MQSVLFILCRILWPADNTQYRRKVMLLDICLVRTRNCLVMHHYPKRSLRASLSGEWRRFIYFWQVLSDTAIYPRESICCFRRQRASYWINPSLSEPQQCQVSARSLRWWCWSKIHWWKWKYFKCGGWGEVEIGEWPEGWRRRSMPRASGLLLGIQHTFSYSCLFCSNHCKAILLIPWCREEFPLMVELSRSHFGFPSAAFK